MTGTAPGAVVLSYEDYQRMTETLKLMENRNFSQRLNQGLSQARRGELMEAGEADVAKFYSPARLLPNLKP